MRVDLHPSLVRLIAQVLCVYQERPYGKCEGAAQWWNERATEEEREDWCEEVALMLELIERTARER